MNVHTIAKLYLRKNRSMITPISEHPFMLFENVIASGIKSWYVCYKSMLHIILV